MLIIYIVYITSGFKTIQVKRMFVLLIQTFIRRQSESMVNRMRIHSVQSIIFWNITRRQAISPVAKSHHVLGRGFTIQRVILSVIKCLSANQNQLFYMKVYNIIIFSPLKGHRRQVLKSCFLSLNGCTHSRYHVHAAIRR